jgi:hypothetical protein
MLINMAFEYVFVRQNLRCFIVTISSCKNNVYSENQIHALNWPFDLLPKILHLEFEGQHSP